MSFREDPPAVAPSPVPAFARGAPDLLVALAVLARFFCFVAVLTIRHYAGRLRSGVARSVVGSGERHPSVPAGAGCSSAPRRRHLGLAEHDAR
jgi:hypothetical protein